MIVASQLVILVHITVPGLREQQLGPDSQTFFKFGFVSSQLLFCRPQQVMGPRSELISEDNTKRRGWLQVA